jgi:hypothetical protein
MPNNRPFHRRFNRPQLPDGKVRRFVHAKATIEEGNLKASIDENGKISLIQEHKDDTYDEVRIPASFAYKIINMVEMTRSTKIIDKDDIPKDEIPKI